MVTERVAGQPAAARHRPGARRRAHASPSTSRPTPCTPSGNAEFETRDAALRLHLDDDAGVDLRLRPRQPRAGAEEAPAGARLRPGALPERAHHGQGGRRHRGADLAGLAPRPEAQRAAAAAALRLRQLRLSPWTRGSRRRGCRCSIAAWSSPSPTSAAAATSAAPGTRPARWAKKATTFSDFIACAEALVGARPDDAGAARDRGRQRRRPADGRGREPAPGAVQGGRRRGAVRRRHQHACSTRPCR